LNLPIFFEENRVFRVYTGGKLFSDLFGKPSEDGYFPEEWIASGVEAVNREPKKEREGVSRTREGRYFDELGVTAIITEPINDAQSHLIAQSIANEYKIYPII
jgi:hypothetical protein